MTRSRRKLKESLAKRQPAAERGELNLTSARAPPARGGRVVVVAHTAEVVRQRAGEWAVARARRRRLSVYILRHSEPRLRSRSPPARKRAAQSWGALYLLPLESTRTMGRISAELTILVERPQRASAALEGPAGRGGLEPAFVESAGELSCESPHRTRPHSSMVSSPARRSAKVNER